MISEKKPLMKLNTRKRKNKEEGEQLHKMEIIKIRIINKNRRKKIINLN